MSVIKCNECNKEIDSKFKVCPNCGNKLKMSKLDNYINKKYNLNKKIVLVVIVVIFSIITFIKALTFANFTISVNDNKPSSKTTKGTVTAVANEDCTNPNKQLIYSDNLYNYYINGASCVDIIVYGEKNTKYSLVEALNKNIININDIFQEKKFRCNHQFLV